MNQQTPGKSEGLTLVELLIAITISVVLAGYSYNLFNSVISGKSKINEIESHQKNGDQKPIK